MGGFLLIIWALDILLERMIHILTDAIVAMALIAYKATVSKLFGD